MLLASLQDYSSDTSRTIQTLRTDYGGQFSNTASIHYLAHNNIRRELTTSYLPEHNVVVERDNRTIMEEALEALYINPNYP